ncbi:MAG TPA: phytanoyl-CoA dioxygenase family protein [Deltaproteobacteria bacterium]|nr:phytanoyl-CoA dioxygenase family protein [Deltaproteobacteria bacterium]
MASLSADLKGRFRRDGFVVVPDLLEGALLDRVTPAIDAAVARRTRTLRPRSARSRYEQSFLQCVNLWEDTPEIRPLTFHPDVAETAAFLLGVPAVRLWHDQALYKEAGGRETDAHQDQPYWPMNETDTVTAWVPLVDVDEELGCMGYVPGSHQVGLRKFVNIFLGEPYDILNDPALQGMQPVFVPTRRGSVAFHHGLTVHLAKANRSDRIRRVHTMIFFRDGSTRAHAGPHPSVDRGQIPVGAPIASDATPIAWPRSQGAFPPRPARPVDPHYVGRHVWPEPESG